MLGLYLHIPFCSSICNYCNFNRGLFDAALKAKYVDALVREIRQAGGAEGADTIYFGGGTPSLLEPSEISRIIETCMDAFSMAPATEITLETNPETVDGARLTAFRDAGVNRVSFGVQSFHDAELKRLGRIHDAARARAALADARNAGFDNVSADLMMWLPQQTIGDWRRNVEELISLGPEHASLYILELYPNAPLKEEMARAAWSQAPDDEAADMYEWSMSRLEQDGYRQYEISNVARPGCESRHNLKYWRDGEWLGFGCGAHSTRAGSRWRNVSATGEYIARVTADASPVAERRNMTRDEQLQEALFMGLRLAEGIDLAALAARYDADVMGRYGPALQPFFEAGLMALEREWLRLTRRGMLVSSEILSVFV